MKKFLLSIASSMMIASMAFSTVSCKYTYHPLEEDLTKWDTDQIFLQPDVMQAIAAAKPNILLPEAGGGIFYETPKNEEIDQIPTKGTLSSVYQNLDKYQRHESADLLLTFMQLKYIVPSMIAWFQKQTTPTILTSYKSIDENFNFEYKGMEGSPNIKSVYDFSKKEMITRTESRATISHPSYDNIQNSLKNIKKEFWGPMVFINLETNKSSGGEYLASYFYVNITIKNGQEKSITNAEGITSDQLVSQDGYYIANSEKTLKVNIPFLASISLF